MGRVAPRWPAAAAFRRGAPTGPVRAARTETERLAAVQAAVTAGAPAADAWREWGDVEVDSMGVPSWEAPSRLRAEARAAAVLAAVHGVPLGDLLDALARVEAVRMEAETAAHAAIAGPRASARVLAWLPAAGLALAVAVEPSVIRVLASPAGATLIALGAGLTWAGRAWMRALVRSASAARELP